MARFKFKVEDRVALDYSASVAVDGHQVPLKKGTVKSRDQNVAGCVYAVKFDGVEAVQGPYREVDLNRTV
jgi:hypothetical protein